MFTGDLVVVWRLYVVWGKNYWYALLPFLMCVSEFSECAQLRCCRVVRLT